MVFALAGDSTITSDWVPGSDGVSSSGMNAPPFALALFRRVDVVLLAAPLRADGVDAMIMP